MSERLLRRITLGCYVSVALLKVWLTLAFGMRAGGDVHLDDRLFMVLAQSLVNGEWLGPYNAYTLMKGPFFPIWIAVTHYAHVPLMLSYQLFHLFACVVTVCALRPILSSRWLRLGLFVFLVFDPSTYTVMASWVVRMGVYVPLTMLLVACAIGLLTRLDERPRDLAPWSIGLGLALAAFWTTREEGVWIVPGLALAAAYGLVGVWRKGESRLLRSVWLLIPAGICLAGLLAVCTLNYANYGVFNTVEFKSETFRRANGALMRVKHDRWNQFAYIPKHVRERIYEASPSFAELRSYMEGPPGLGWGRVAEISLSGGRASPPDIRGGWIVFALREAAALRGHHDSAPKAAIFYSRIADETNAACDDGRLTCGPERASLMPPWRGDYVPLLVESFRTGLIGLVSLEDVEVRGLPSTGPVEGRTIFEDLGRTRLNPDPGERLPRLRNQDRLDRLRLGLLGRLNVCYRLVVPVAAVLASLALLAIALVELRRHRFSPILAILVVLVVLFFTRMAMLSLISVMSFEGMWIRYFAPLYPILLLFCFLTLQQLCRQIRSVQRRRAASTSPRTAG